MAYEHVLFATVVALTIAPLLAAQANPRAGAAQRPPIVGVANISLRVATLEAARAFYGRELGYEEPYAVEGGAVFKVNDRQFIHVTPILKSDAEDRLIHIAFETTDARGLRDYLASKGVEVPAAVQPDKDGNLSFFIHDADGHPVGFVQYMPGSTQSRNFGKSLAATRVSERMIHVGFLVQDREAADKLFKDVLGFRLQWQGGMTDTRVDWVSMRVPDGADWLEYMLNQRNPSPKTRGVMNHLALGVPSVAEGYKTVLSRGLSPEAEKPKIGRDGKWQLNLYDPDLTRAELMEPKPVQPPCCSPIIEY